MTPREPAPRLRWQAVSQVVVAFAGGGGGGALVQTAAAAARALGAGISGLYVRDVALDDLAGLPFATMLDASRTTPQRPTGAAIERSWRREEARCRALLGRAAAASAPAFETVAGRLETALAPRLARDTLVAISAADGLHDSALWPAAQTLAEAAGAVLVVPASVRSEPRDAPVLAIDDGDRAGAETIALADRIAQASGRPLAVLALGTPLTAQAIAARARALATSERLVAHGWPDWKADELARPIARIAPWMIVGDLAGRPFAETGQAMAILRRLAAPLLLLSPPADGG